MNTYSSCITIPASASDQDDHIIPWIIPALPSALVKLVRALGNETSFRKGEIVLHEHQTMDRLLFIRRGLLAQAVINFQLNKPMAMNLFTAGRLIGILNFFAEHNAPRRIIALQDVWVTSVPYSQFRRALEKDFVLYKEMVRYCERASQSELNGMMGIFTLPAEDRLRLLFVAILCSAGYQFDADIDEWVALPFRLRHADILKVIYTSQITLNRILAVWHKNEWLRREGNNIYLKSGNLYPIFEWVMRQ